MASVLIIKTSSLGDVVHQMPAIADAASRFPGLRISWVVEEAFAPLAKLHPAVADVIPVATRRWRSQLASAATWREVLGFKARLRRPNFDKVIDSQGLLRSALIARMALGERHGYDSASVRERLAARFYDVHHAVRRDLHAVARNRLLTGLAMGYAPDADVDYGLLRPRDATRSPYAVLLHGTSRPAKEWRDEQWISLGRALRRLRLGVVLPWGSETERQLCVRLSQAIEGSEILPRQPLDLTAKVIADAALVVGVDTGLMHLAAAYRVPLVAVFVSTDPALTGPLGSGAMTVLGGRGVAPTAADVIDAAHRLLG